MDSLSQADRPLEGVRIMVTRPAEPHDPLAERLARLGAMVILQPAICIAPPEDWQPVDAALSRLADFDWLVFSSANGVRFLLDRLHQLDGNPGRLHRVQLAAIGPGTGEELARHGFEVALMPDEYRAESLADCLTAKAVGRRVLLARASRGRDVLPERLAEAGIHVEQVVVYQSTDVATPDAAIVTQLCEGQIDWTTVTSSAIARSLVRLFGDNLRRTKLASISPITSVVLRELGHEPAAEADEFTMPGLIAAILEYPHGQFDR